MRVTKDTLIGEILRMDMGTAQILTQAGMHCVAARLRPGEPG